ncbi:hypothetical protein AURDEDRAFT_127215 [Auricularia subglabra TFB-10046 SS5]|nr:hypothetical protein AURDEDRAFT_127215 [Auricularia subglabra TFB-10046 SS5]
MSGLCPGIGLDVQLNEGNHVHLEQKSLVVGLSLAGMDVQLDVQEIQLDIRFHPWSKYAFRTEGGIDVHISPIRREQLAGREHSEAKLAEAEAWVAIMQANLDKYLSIHTSTVVKDSSCDREPLIIYYVCDPVAFEEKRKEMHAEGVATTDEEINNLMRDEPSSFHGLLMSWLHSLLRSKTQITLPVTDHPADSMYIYQGLILN